MHTQKVTLSNTHKNMLQHMKHPGSLPYSGKLSKEKTFVNFEVLWLFAKVFFITGNIKLVMYIVQLAFLSLSLPLSLSHSLSLVLTPRHPPTAGY